MSSFLCRRKIRPMLIFDIITNPTKMRIKEVLFYILIYVVTNCECKNYSQYTLYRTVPQNDDHLFFFFNESKKFNINYWRAPGHLNQTVEFIVSPYEKDLFLREAAKNDIFLSVVIPDLQR